MGVLTEISGLPGILLRLFTLEGVLLFRELDRVLLEILHGLGFFLGIDVT